jgi:hypothetical protein
MAIGQAAFVDIRTGRVGQKNQCGTGDEDF